MKLVPLLLSVASIGGCASAPSVLSYPGTSSLLKIQAYDAKKNVDRDVSVVVYGPTVAARAKPAVILLSGCSGSFGSAAGELVRQLTAAGAVVAEVKSIETFGDSCNTGQGRPGIMGSARAGHAYLARDALVAKGLTTDENVGVLGFSHGGWTITHLALEDSQEAMSRKPFTAAVAYYPLCLDLMNMPNRPAVVPTLILTGTADTWTAPARCEPLVARSAGMIQMHLYEGATHAFDYQIPTHTRMTPFGPSTMGYDDAYTKDSIKRSMKFLLEHLRF